MPRDTLLNACILRAGAAIVRDDLAAGRDPDTPPSKRETMRAIWRGVHDGGKVASLIVVWAVALDDLDVDELGMEAFAEWANESRATAYRRCQEFRRIWPEYNLPNELAGRVLAEARKRGVHPAPSLSVRVPSVA